MAASKFTPEVREGLLECFRDGLSTEDACRVVDVRKKTVKSWITRGNKEEEGDYFEFARAVEDARQEASEKEAPLTEKELLLVVSKAARGGSVAAMKLAHEILRAKRSPGDDDSERSEFDDLEPDDELAQRREAKQG